MGEVLSWRAHGERAAVLELAGGGAEWLEVKRYGANGSSVWRVEGRLGGNHYKIGEAFDSPDAARGAALLLAVRLVPAARREPLLAALGAIPDAWWWRIVPTNDGSAEHRSVFSSRTVATSEAALHGGRAAGAGWWLWVHGPGSTLECGRVPAVPPVGRDH